jgi:hypothetical protein
MARSRPDGGGVRLQAANPAPRLRGCYRGVRAQASTTTVPASVSTLAQSCCSVMAPSVQVSISRCLYGSAPLADNVCRPPRRPALLGRYARGRPPLASRRAPLALRVRHMVPHAKVRPSSRWPVRMVHAAKTCFRITQFCRRSPPQGIEQGGARQAGEGGRANTKAGSQITSQLSIRPSRSSTRRTSSNAAEIFPFGKRI